MCSSPRFRAAFPERPTIVTTPEPVPIENTLIAGSRRLCGGKTSAALHDCRGSLAAVPGKG